ncbi:hypothetical protein [Candidatus Macondimonas diazotrophica]|jgi:hypothetical protein|uniref:Uncharacterized protein n=1 Tax=Candidatus Macondimonas diazotrophica TaxID=2305248 RepID=A0A4Z0F7H8_9GAMM|nr:hypothetical protein [Candidatus Macondimonas diazotrophica]TFZ80942.1 hypothetical protein E4680_13630 [Candidatus Macondimonas diazotrophica]
MEVVHHADGDMMTDYSHHAYMIQVAVADAAVAIQETWTAPSVVFRPKVFKDGELELWCALYGDSLLSGVSAWGATPEEACRNFDYKWRRGES